jgi:GNAT superfamily N-acetyltransferase
MEHPGAGPAVVVRRLGPGDESVLALLAREDADFDLDERTGPRTALGAEVARAHLTDPHVLHWAAWAGTEVVGFVFCLLLPMRKEPARELLLYEIGVRAAWRRRGIGRRLIAAMTQWMHAEGIEVAWVLAGHPGAERFYEACGFRQGAEPATYLELDLQGHSRVAL